MLYNTEDMFKNNNQFIDHHDSEKSIMDVKALTSGDRSGRRNAYYRETRAEAAESNIKNLKTISTAAVNLLLHTDSDSS